MTEGESYSDLGGQLADPDDKERGRLHIARLKERLREAEAKAEQERIEALENEENVDG